MTTEEQRQQKLANDEMRQLAQQLDFAKRAFKHHELISNTPDVDDEWEKFAASHAEELNALDEGAMQASLSSRLVASFIGVLLASGIAFAAIWSLTTSPSPKAKEETTSIVENSDGKTNHTPLLESEVDNEASYVFNNVPLDSMLTVIAAAHGLGVEFENEAARELRFHFVWKREDSLSRVVEKLNTFEAVNIGVEDKKLVVR